MRGAWSFDRLTVGEEFSGGVDVAILRTLMLLSSLRDSRREEVDRDMGTG